MRLVQSFVLALTLSVSVGAFAQSHPRIDADLAKYDAEIQRVNEAFAKLPADPSNREWVGKKLQHMVDTDQYMRKFPAVIHEHQYSDEERTYFFEKFGPRWQQLDQQNTINLKSLLTTYSWFSISEFGSVADQNAWLLVQHADHDPNFQKSVLTTLERLYKVNETKPANYAYLFDRVAASWSDPTRRTLQRYGTQGTCVGPGKWEPIPYEDPENIDARRASVGLGTLAEYIGGFKDVCK